MDGINWPSIINKQLKKTNIYYMKRKLTLLTILLAGMAVGISSCKHKKEQTPHTSDSIQVLGSNNSHEEDINLAPDQMINDAARFVAGLPVLSKNSKLFALTQTKEWKNHARNMDQIWNSYQQTSPKVLSFSVNELEPINKNCKTLFYPFGGPDFLFSSTFFPDMNTYFLIGLERTGHEIQVKHPSAKTYKLYQDAVSDVLSLSFFRTRDMNTEEINDTIDGVVPIISMLMARMDKQIVSVKNKIINENGDIVSFEEATDKHQSNQARLVEIAFFRPGKRKLQKMYYYATDLSNEGLERNKPLMAYLKKIDRKSTATFIKSASYLMHENSFSTIRGLILDSSTAILQDDSGIPLAFYPSNKWGITLYGTFYKPTSTYTKYAQPSLRDAYQMGDPKPLSFRIGFARQSNLQLMVRK